MGAELLSNFVYGFGGFCILVIIAAIAERYSSGSGLVFFLLLLGPAIAAKGYVIPLEVKRSLWSP